MYRQNCFFRQTNLIRERINVVNCIVVPYSVTNFVIFLCFLEETLTKTSISIDDVLLERKHIFENIKNELEKF